MTEKQSLLSIANDLTVLNESIETNEGELTDIMERELDQIQSQLATKADHYAYRVQRLELAVKFWEDREEQAAQSKKVLKNHLKRMKDRISFAMSTMNTNEIYGDQYIWKIRQSSTPKLIINEAEILPSYKVKVTEEVIDKDRIKEELKQGKEVKGAALEYSTTLTCKTNTELKKG